MDTRPDPTVVASADELGKLQQQADQYLAGWQRAKADYLNLKKQTEREKDDLVKFANAALLMELMPVYDNLKRALDHIPAEQRSIEWVKGVTHIYQQFRQFLERLGIQEIPTMNQPFNHELHHAVSKEHRSGVKRDVVLAEVKTGFTLNGKVIEPAMVIVSDGLEAQGSSASPAEQPSAPNPGQKGGGKE